jgi:hypothetical protein
MSRKDIGAPNKPLEGLDYEGEGRRCIELPLGPWERMVPCVVCEAFGTPHLVVTRVGPEQDDTAICSKEHFEFLTKLLGRGA